MRSTEGHKGYQPHMLEPTKIGKVSYKTCDCGKVSCSTLAYANETRNWRIYSDLAQILIDQARRLYVGDNFDFELKVTVYSFDP